MFFTDEGLKHLSIDSNADYDCVDDNYDHLTIIVKVNGLDDLGERLFGIDLQSEDYDDAWIDVEADIYVKLMSDGSPDGRCDQLTFSLTTNNSELEDRDVGLVLTSVIEERKIFDRLSVSDDGHLNIMIMNWMKDHTGEKSNEKDCL